MAWGLPCQLRCQGWAGRLAAWAAMYSTRGPARSSSCASTTAWPSIPGTLQHGCRVGGGRTYSDAAWEGAPAGVLVAGPGSASDDAVGRPARRAQLVREFIHDSLYHPKEGYFTRHNALGGGVVGSLQRPLDFAGIGGQADYLQAVRQVYLELQAAWLTPVEILQPHYGRAVAAFILHRWRQLAANAAPEGAPEPPLLIYEIGGGTGTLARDILDWLRAEHPQAYRSMRYRCIEISPVLAAIQERRLAEAGHAERFAVRQHDATDLAAWRRADKTAGGDNGGGGGAGSTAASSSEEGARSGTRGSCSGGGIGGAWDAQQHAFVVMCEVLDNLPHDRVCRDMGSSEWQQTLVAQGAPIEGPAERRRHRRQRGGPALHEVLQPASDPLILRCLQAVQAAESSDDGGSHRPGLALSVARAWHRLVGEAAEEIWWLPTGCLQLLDTLHEALPSHTLIAADFDQLPEVVIAGVNAPLVATTHDGSTHDHGSYLVPRGTADIFFPTDFRLLCTLYYEAAAAAAARRPAGNSGCGHQAAPQPAAGTTAEHMPTPDFMLRHAPDPSATRTRSGYNPLLQDYSNTAFFVGSSGSGGGGGAR